MITVIHGDDISKSREYFNELKQKHKDFIVLDGNKLTITDLVQNIEGSTFFSDTKAIFIEEFQTKRKKTDKNVKEILNFINKNSREATFIFWEAKEVLKRDLSLFKDAVVKFFKLPKNIFLFLDNLKPNNSKNLINLFHQALDNGIKEELILFMLQRQVRILLAISPCHLERSERSLDSSASPQNDIGIIDEISRLAPWQMSKLERQAQMFNILDLKKIYKKLYTIEIGQKTGALPLSLSQSIDFLLLEI